MAAKVPRSLHPTVRGTAPGAAPAPDATESGRRSGATQEPSIEDITGVLRANLSRGFLESEARIRQITEALNDVILLSDEASGRVCFVNAAYEQIWGRPRAELYLNPLALLEAVHPDDRDRVRDALIGPHREDFDLEFRVVRSPGDERWMWTRGFVVRGVDGELNRVASITTDVTARKQAEASHERLIRGFTHDVKNPLGAADGYLSLLQEGVFGDMSDAQAKSVARARRSIHTALNLVSGLLEIERAEAGQLSLQRERVELHSTLQDIVEEFRATATAKSLDLMALVQKDEPAVVVESDATRVRQILANLISNAVKYTQPGGRISGVVRIAQRREAPWRGRWAAITVADNGPGIPLEKQPLVFREFARFDPGAAAGSGIGLAISRRLARALGGDITFTSTPRVRTAFTLWLPIAEEEQRDSAPERPVLSTAMC